MNTKNRVTLLASSIAAAFACQAAVAADTPAPVVLPEVIVTAALPNTVALDTGRQASASDSADLLRNLPGVSLNGAGGVSSLPAIRGLADDRLRIQVDGMDLVSACANHMNPALSYIAPSQVDSVQLLSGITPVSAGGDSIGGTIRVKSAKPEFAAPGQASLLSGEAGMFYRSNGDVRGANAAATFATDTLSLRYNGSTVKAANYQAANDVEVGSSRYESRNHALALAWRNTAHLVELRLGLQDVPYQGFPNQRMDMTGNDSKQANLRYQGDFEWGMLEARIYREHTRHAMNFGPDKQFWYGAKMDVPGMPMDTEGHNTGASLKAELELSVRDLVRIGSDYQRYRLSDWWAPSGGGMAPDTFWNINNGRRDRSAVFAEWDARWSAQWFSQLGVRGELVTMDAGKVQGYNATYAADSNAFNARSRRREDHNLDLTAQARYAAPEGGTYEFGYARKTRSPNLHERYTWSTGGMAMNMVNLNGDGNGYVGNPDLRPETAHTLSASAEWQAADDKSWRLKLAPFYTRVNDYVDARCLASQCKPNAFVYLRFINQDARLYGGEMSGELVLATGGAWGSLTGTGVLNYVNGKSRVTGQNLYNIMPLNTTLALVHQLGAWKNTAEVQLVSAKDDVSLVRSEIATAGYGLLNLRTEYRWKQWQLSAGVDNLLDRLYDLPLGGAYVGKGRTMMQAGTPYGIQVPGMARSAHASLTLRF